MEKITKLNKKKKFPCVYGATEPWLDVLKNGKVV